MRPACLILLLSVTVLVTAYDNDDWVGDEDPVEQMFAADSSKEEAERPQPIKDTTTHAAKVKRNCHHEHQDSAQHVRSRRQVHAYEVHEDTQETAMPSSPPYEEMLAASADHYHRVYAAPGAPLPAYYINAAANTGKAPLAMRQVPFVNGNVFVPLNTQSEAPHGFVAQKPQNADQLNVAPGPAEIPVNEAVPVLVTLSPQPVVLSTPQKIASDDQEGAAVNVAKQAQAKTFHHVHGGGAAQQAEHQLRKGGKKKHGFKENQYLDKGAKGFKTDEKHRKEYEEAAGKKKAHRDHADHKGSHVEEAHGLKGAHFNEKKGHKKGHKTKGYHNKYHKDEFHKEHKFYDDYHKSGEHHRFGKFNAKHKSNESGKKRAQHVNAGHDYVERGKKGYSNKGHLDSDHKGYNGKHGHEERHEKHHQHGKKGAREGGKEWGYAKKN